MKHRKRKIAALVLALLLMLLAVGGTWAYFTKEARATNVITTGTVELALRFGEKTAGEETGGANDDAEVSVQSGEIDFENVMPGSEVTCAATITNTGTADFYLRVRANTTLQFAAGVTGTPDPALVTLNWDTENWTASGGYYYYNSAVAPGTAVTPFTTIGFSTEMGNDYQGCAGAISVEAQAVQVKNNPIPEGSDVTGVPGWPAGDTTGGMK